MAKDDKAEKDTKFFAVRDLPEQTRKAIKHYAVDHDVTMGQAIEAMVAGHYGSEEDRVLIEALIKVYGRVIAEDMLGAKEEAKQVTSILERQRRLPGSTMLPSPPPPIPSYAALTPEQVAERYAQAYYIDADFELAARLLASIHPWRQGRTFDETVEKLREGREDPIGRERVLDIVLEKSSFMTSQSEAAEVILRYTITFTANPNESPYYSLEHFTLLRELGGWFIFVVGPKKIVERERANEAIDERVLE